MLIFYFGCHGRLYFQSNVRAVSRRITRSCCTIFYDMKVLFTHFYIVYTHVTTHCKYHMQLPARMQLWSHTRVLRRFFCSKACKIWSKLFSPLEWGELGEWKSQQSHRFVPKISRLSYVSQLSATKHIFFAQPSSQHVNFLLRAWIAN